jgi:hypothetical protein
MNCKHVQELLPLYVSRDLAERSAQLIQAHLQSCASCAVSSEEYYKTHHMLQEFAPPQFGETLYDSMRQDVLREIQRETLESPRAVPRFVLSLVPNRLTWALAAALLFVVALSAVYVVTKRRGSGTSDQQHLVDRRNTVDQPAVSPASPERAQPPDSPEQKRRGLAGFTNPQVRRRQTIDRRAPSTSVETPDQTKLIAEAARNSNNPANRDAVTVGDSSKTEKPLRMEIQTTDPNIRIIWFSAQPAKQDSPNKFSKGI